MNYIKLDVVDSEKKIFNGEVEYFIAPSIDGEVGIYPHHVPFVCILKSGVVRLKVKDQEEQLILALSGGFLEVSKTQATILADVVKRTDQLDEQMLLQEKEKAFEILKSKESINTKDVAIAEVALNSAIAQLKALEYIRKHSK